MRHAQERRDQRFRALLMLMSHAVRVLTQNGGISFRWERLRQWCETRSVPHGSSKYVLSSASPSQYGTDKGVNQESQLQLWVVVQGSGRARANQQNGVPV